MRQIPEATGKSKRHEQIIKDCADRLETIKDGRWHDCSSGGIGPSGYPLPGVYIIMIEGEALYIGESQNVTKRICKHYEYHHVDHLYPAGYKAYWMGSVCMESDTDMGLGKYKMVYEPDKKKRQARESALIRRLKPPANIACNAGWHKR